MRMSWISHLLAVVAGVLIWQAIWKRPDNATVSPYSESNQVVSRDPAEAEVLLRLGALQVQNDPPASSVEEVKEPEPKVEQSFSQYLLEMRSEDQADAAKELKAMLKRSEEFRMVEDLRVPLMEALTKGDPSKAGVAIFIEWYRRDPVAAMNELAARPSWSRDVLSEQAMVLHLTPDALLDQLSARNRSSDFREAIIESLAEYWVDTDDLRSLSAAYDKVGGIKADTLMEEFLGNRWVPRDGAVDLAYFSSGMSQSCRKAFLTKLLDLSSNDPSREWTNGIAAPLMRETLGEEQVAALRKETAEREANQPTGSSCGGGGEEEYNQPDRKRVAELMAEITPKNENEMLDDALDRMLQHDQDYLELFGAGKLSADEIFKAMISQIPGSKDHELGLQRMLYQKLAIWNPKAAVEWASGNLSDADLLSVTIKWDGNHTEARALRMLDLMENLPLKFKDERYVGFAPLLFYRRLQDWKTLDAEATNQALNRSPKAKEIAEKITKEPSREDSSEGSSLPSDGELSY